MSHIIRYNESGHYILLVVTGRFTIADLKHIAPKVAAVSGKKGCFRVLIDMRAAGVDLSFMDVFNGPRFIDEAGISRRTKRALVVPASFAEADFLETVSRNQGQNLKVFRDPEEALDWLLGD